MLCHADRGLEGVFLGCHDTTPSAWMYSLRLQRVMRVQDAIFNHDTQADYQFLDLTCIITPGTLMADQIHEMHATDQENGDTFNTEDNARSAAPTQPAQEKGSDDGGADQVGTFWDELTEILEELKKQEGERKLGNCPACCPSAMSTSTPEDQAALSAPTPAKSWSICGFFAPISKLESTMLAEQKLKDAKQAGLVPEKKQEIKEIALLCTKLSQEEHQAEPGRELDLVLLDGNKVLMEKLREHHGCDVVVGTRNDGLRVLIGRKCLLAVLRPVGQSLSLRHDAILDDRLLLEWHLGGHPEGMEWKKSSSAFRNALRNWAEISDFP
eukprot:3865047-Rhodomonas_salina.2